MNAGNAFAWWRQLQPLDADGTRNHAGDAGALARLRRGELRDVLIQPETVDLYHQLGCTHPHQLTDVALCAGVLVHVRTHVDKQSTAELLAGAGLNHARFRRLLTTDDVEERLIELRRALAMTQGRANVPDLARACLYWTDTLGRWSLDFYRPAPATAS
jgi:CRISPR type I-E-associated protein CasB/Cse2